MRSKDSRREQRGAIRCEQLEDAGGAHAAADAHGDHSVARAPRFHLLEKRCGEFGAGAAEGMAERDGAAVDVDAGRDRDRECG